jgi:hypothetical protein
MSDAMIVLTPLLILLILAAFRFTGCGSFGSTPEQDKKTVTGPPLVIAPVDPPPVKPPTYEELITSTAGFAALWPLNETGGNAANVVGPLNPAANGVYTVAGGQPPGSGYTIGQPGVLNPKDPADFAPSFNGTAAFVQVQFNGPLNPVKAVAGFTIELWVKPNPTALTLTQVLVSSHRFDSGSVQQGYEIALIKVQGQANHQVRGRVFANGAMSQAIVQPLQGDPDEWRHIVFTYEQLAAFSGPTVSIQVRLAKSTGSFKDGPHGANNYAPVTSAQPSTLRFGAGHQTGQTAGDFFAGQIDNVAFYNAAMSQADIDKHFNMF